MTDDTLVAADAERVLEPASKPKGTRQESKARPSGKTRERNNDLLNDLNARHAVILDVGGHCVVADLMPRGDGKAPVQLISFDNFKKRYANRYASADESSNPKQAGGWWLAHRRRRQYDGLILEPSKPDIVTERGRQFFQSVARLGC
jgi:hypothetical protein